jgi:hypothetical protein
LRIADAPARTFPGSSKEPQRTSRSSEGRRTAMNNIDRRRFSAMLLVQARRFFRHFRNLAHGTECNRHVRSKDVASRPRYRGDRRMMVGVILSGYNRSRIRSAELSPRTRCIYWLPGSSPLFWSQWVLSQRTLSIQMHQNLWSTRRGYSHYFREMVSLCVIDADSAELARRLQ